MLNATPRRTGGLIAALAFVGLAVGIPAASGQGLDVQLKPVVDKVIAGCRAAGAKRITVADFTDLQGQVTELGRFVAEELGSNLVEAGPPFGVVDRANLRTILAEHKLNMSGLVNPDTAKRLGQIAGVDGIVTGTITPLGDSVRISVKVIATETATVMAASRAEVARTKAIEELLARGVQAASGAGAGPAPAGAGAASASGGASGQQAPAGQAVFENALVRLSVRSLKQREDSGRGGSHGGSMIMSVRVDSKLAAPLRFMCYPFALVDENGERWDGRGSRDGFVSSYRWLQVEPGTPSLESVDFQRGRSQAEGRAFDLSGKCEAEFQGRRANFTLTMTGLRAQ